MEAQEPPIFIVVPGRCYRSRPVRRHPQPDLPPGRGPRGRRGRSRSPTSRARSTSSRGRSSAPSARPASGPASSRSPSRASRSTSPAFAAAARGELADGSRDPLCKGIGWIEILGAGMVDPNVFGFVRRDGLRPRARPGLRVRDGDRADRDAQARGPRPAQVLRERRPRAGAVPMKVALLLADRVLRSRALAPRSSASCSSMHSIEVERISHVGRAERRGLRRRPGGLRPSSTRTPTGCASARSTTGDGDADDRLRRAQRRRRPDRRRSRSRARDARRREARARRSCAGVESDGMILSERELELGDDHDGIMVLDDRRRARARRSTEVLPISEPVLELEPTSEPGRLLRRLRRRARGARDHRRDAGAAAVGGATPRRPGEGAVERLRLGHRRGPRALPALHRPRVHRRRRSARRRRG